MAALSKNQRRGQKTQRHYCPCGGEIKMGGKMIKAKLRWSATCDKCGTLKRRPSDF